MRFKSVFTSKNKTKTKKDHWFDYILQSKIPMSFLFLASLCSLIPITFCFTTFSHKIHTLYALEKKLNAVETKAHKAATIQKMHSHYLKEFGASDKTFIHEYLEKRLFLEQDVKILSKIQNSLSHDLFAPISQRLHYLTSGQNQMKFIQTKQTSNAEFYETFWELNTPVDVNLDDLKKILTLVEGVKIERHLPNPYRPQLLITSFSIENKEYGDGYKIFSLDLNLVQRGPR